MPILATMFAPKRPLNRFVLAGVLWPAILVFAALVGGGFQAQLEEWVNMGAQLATFDTPVTSALVAFLWCLSFPALIGGHVWSIEETIGLLR
jgi:hypothetical protein